MKRVTMILVIIFLGKIALADSADDAGAKLHEYFDAFNAKDTEKIANKVYSTPLHIGGGSGHRILSDPDTAIANLDNLYEQIEAQGWKESRISDLKICVASETLALVDTRYSRIDQDGNPIPPAIRTTLYVLQNIEGAWRIVAFYGHDSDTRPSC